MYNTGTIPQRNILNSLLKQNDSVEYAVCHRLSIPYLDDYFKSCPSDLVGIIIEACLSIFISRYCIMTPKGLVRLEKELGMELAGKDSLEIAAIYEEIKTDLLLSEIIEYELTYGVLPGIEIMAVTRELEYKELFERLYQHFHHFLQSLDDNLQDGKFSYLIGLFEHRGGLDIKYFVYRPELETLFLYIKM